MKIHLMFILLGLLLIVPHIISAETIYTRYFESIDGDLRSDILQVYSVTALRGEKITLVVYGLEEGMAPAIAALDPTGVTLVEDLNPNLEDVSLVQFNATVDGIYPFVVYRQTQVEGLVRIMLFEGDPIDATTSILDTVDPLLPSRAYLLAGERSGEDGDYAGQAIEFSVQSLPFEPVEGAEDEELPQPQFFASRATRLDTPELEERLAAVERSDWMNNPTIQLYTLNIRPVPENQDAVQQEVFRAGDIEIPTLEQPLLPYDIILTIKPGIDPPIRLERPFCTGSLPVVGRTLIVQNIPGEAYTQIGTLTGGDVVEIIGTGATGNYVQITWDAALNGSGWVQYQEVFQLGAPECVRVIPVEEDMERLDEAIQEVIDEIRERFAPQEVAEVPTPIPTPQITPEFTPQPVVSNIQLTNTVDNANPFEGSTISFIIALGNFSTTLIEDAQVDILIPIGLTFVGTSEHCLEGSLFPICILGDIPTGEVRGFLLHATVDPNTVGQTLTTIAETSSSDVLLQAPEDVTVIERQAQPPIAPTLTPTMTPTPIPNADLSLSKIVDDTTPRELDPVTYTLTATNNGADVATDVTVSDVLPASVSYVSSTPSQGSYDSASGIWTVGELDVGASATLIIQGTVNTGTYNTTIINTSTITALSSIDPITSNNTASVSVLVACTAGGIPVAASDATGLINAMNTANGNVDSTTICLVNSTYTLTTVADTSDGDNGLPSVTTPVTILGSGAIITRSGAAPTFRIVHVALSGNLTLNSVTLENGIAQVGPGFERRKGGAIYNLGSTLTLNNTTLSNNLANGGGGGGGGIYNSGGTVSINSSSSLVGNSGFQGGGIWSPTGSVFITDSNISSNRSTDFGGGGIKADSVNITNSLIFDNEALSAPGGGINAITVLILSNSTVDNNRAKPYGGGISIDNATISNSTISNNTSNNDGGGIRTTGITTISGGSIINNRADFNTTGVGVGAGIYNAGTLTINSGTVISGNASGISNAGGIFNTGTGTVSISGGVVIGGSGTGNQGVYGGGIYNESTSVAAVTIANSTISDNYGGYAGGIYSTAGTVTIQTTTIINNAVSFAGGGGGVSIQAGATLDIQLSSNITNNTSNGAPDDCTGGGTFNTDASNTLGVGCPAS